MTTPRRRPTRRGLRIAAASITILATSAAHAQPQTQPQTPPEAPSPKLEALRALAQPIRSIDPADHDFSDLAGLRAAIGDARVVMLGEATHGDGAAFLAKCRLVAFLHQEMGFDVLAFEAGMFDCHVTDHLIADPKHDLLAAAGIGIPAMWTQSAQVFPLLEYVRASHATDRPLTIAGIDHTFVGSKHAAGWAEWFIAQLDAVAPEALDAAARESLRTGFMRAMQAEMGNAAPAQAVAEAWRKLHGVLDAHAAEIEAEYGAKRLAFLKRTLDDAIITAEWLVAQHEAHAKRGDRAAQERLSLRDQRMGENLVWLAEEEFKGRKIIIWLASFHALYEISDVRSGIAMNYKGLVTAGEVARTSLGDALYSIAITASTGSSGRVWEPKGRPLTRSPSNSLEGVCDGLEMPFAFVPLRGLPEEHWLAGRYSARPLGYMPMQAKWAEQVDAFLYIREMFPAGMEDPKRDGETKGEEETK